LQALIIEPTTILADQTYAILKKFLTGQENFNLTVSFCTGQGKQNGNQFIDVIDSKITVDEKQIATSQIIVCTPGKIYELIKRRKVSVTDLKCLVLDEYDQLISPPVHGGKNNRNNHASMSEQIIEITTELIPKNTQICLFSATTSPDTTELAQKIIAKNEYVIEPFYIGLESTNIAVEALPQYYIMVNPDNDPTYDPMDAKLDILHEIFEKIKMNKPIVFVNYSQTAEIIVNNMPGHKFSKTLSSQEQSKSEIMEAVEKFKSNETNVLISTYQQAARGLDVNGIDVVLIPELPSLKENLIHAIGRTARYGKQGRAIILFTRDDHRKLEEMHKVSKNVDMRIVKSVDELKKIINL
jgi:translation initiation factor 4A